MNKEPLRVVFAGTPPFAQVALQALLDRQEELKIRVVAAYTQPDKKAGRGQKIAQSPVKALALERGVPVEQPPSFSLKSEFGKVSRETLAAYRPDLMIVAAYGLLLPLGVLKTPRLGCLNIHASLLPRWRGAAPIQRAILAGDTTTGISIMQMAQGLDTGDVLYRVACPIDPKDSSQSLHDKLAILGAQAISHTLMDLPNLQKNAEKQDDANATYAQKIATAEGQIDWSEDAYAVYRRVRALSAFGYLRGERVKILDAEPIKDGQITREKSGAVVSVGRKAVLVACGTDDKGERRLINLTAMQWPGGKALNAEQIAAGNKIQDGDVFCFVDA